MGAPSFEILLYYLYTRIEDPVAYCERHRLLCQELGLKGRIIEQGERKKVLAPPHHEYTDKLLASVPEMDPDWLDNLLAERASAYM